MDPTFLIIIGGLLVVFYALYAGLIKKRNSALEALSTVDVQLKQRLDLVPNILKIAKKFMEHEKALLTDITTLRTQAIAPYNPNEIKAVQEHLATAEQLSTKMSQLMLNVENYPTLKSDQTMIQAMQSYNEAEAQIAAARRFYNSAITLLNNAVEIFPSSMIAKMIGITQMPFFKAEEAAHAAINTDDFLK